MDCVLRNWYNDLDSEHLALIFYADDGRLGGDVAPEVQHGLDLLTSLFARIGLHLNTDKTKAMITLGRNKVSHISATAYKRRFDQTLPSSRARALRKITCSLCGSSMNQQHLPTHLREIHQILSMDSFSELGKHQCDHDSSPREQKVARIACESCPTLEVCDPQDPLHVHDIHGATFFDDMTFNISMPKSEHCMVSCPVPFCPAHPKSREKMYAHFMHMHPDLILRRGGGGGLSQSLCLTFPPSWWICLLTIGWLMIC